MQSEEMLYARKHHFDIVSCKFVEFAMRGAISYVCPSLEILED
jgi:hypothetical protein